MHRSDGAYKNLQVTCKNAIQKNTLPVPCPVDLLTKVNQWMLYGGLVVPTQNQVYFQRATANGLLLNESQ